MNIETKTMIDNDKFVISLIQYIDNTIITKSEIVGSIKQGNALEPVITIENTISNDWGVLIKSLDIPKDIFKAKPIINCYHAAMAACDRINWVY